MSRFRLFFAILLTPLFLLSPLTVRAQAPGDFVLRETSIVVPANGSAELSFQGFCLDFGKPFPTALGVPNSRADDNVLKVVKTALEEQMADRDPLGTQLAIWAVREGEVVTELYPNDEFAAEGRAQALLDASQDASVTPLSSELGIALDKAVADGIIEVTSQDFAFSESEMARPDDSPYHGEGTMILRNLTSEAVTIYYPFGTVLDAVNDAEQDLVTYATELEKVPTPTPTPAPAPQTMANTGDSGAGTAVPWVVVGLGVVMLAGAGLLMLRPQPR